MIDAQRAGGAEDQATWSYGSMVGFGYFGADSPGGRSHRNRSLALLALFVVVNMVTARSAMPPAVRVVGALMMVGAWAGIVWSGVRYVAGLDELSRLIQLEAAAVAFGAVIVVGSVWHALSVLGVIGPLAGGAQARSWVPLLVFPTILVAELVRGVALALLARARR